MSLSHLMAGTPNKRGPPRQTPRHETWAMNKPSSHPLTRSLSTEDQMTKRKHLYLLLGLALLLVGGSAFGGTQVTVDATSETTAAPLVEIVVYDGTDLPATVIAGCSESDCMGLSGSGTGTVGTGTVTHVDNYVGWSVAGGNPKGRIYLYVDNILVSSARTGKLLVWSTTKFSAGSHTLEAMALNSAGVEGWSTPL